MDYRKMWYRLRDEMLRDARAEEDVSLDKKEYGYKGDFARNTLFMMIDMELDSEIHEENLRIDERLGKGDLG